ncbi:hypothetical protein [Nocardia sp. NPDC004711]
MTLSVLARSTVGIAAAAAMGVATIVSATTASAATQSDQQPQLSSSTICVNRSYTITVPNLFPGNAEIYMNETIDDGVPADAVPTATNLSWIGENSSTFTTVWSPTKAGTYHLMVTEVPSSLGPASSVYFKTLDVAVTAASIGSLSAGGVASLGCLISSISAG